MSGLCGIVTFDGRSPHPEAIRRMAEAVPYRGKAGLWHDARAALGQLTITDRGLRPPTHMEPFISGDFVVVADARIDNRASLLEEMPSAMSFDREDPTDAELILAAYRRWGAEMPSHLIGDFAFAIWDSRTSRLFAARDPMGMRAFYYRLEPGRCVFATELRQLLVVEGIPVGLDEAKAAAYLVGLDGSADWTFFEGISQLSPAHSLVAEHGHSQVRRYWDIDPGAVFEGMAEDEQEESFREVFTEAVRCRLAGPDPVGILLSGGLDSGSVASTAGWLRREEGCAQGGLRAYSWSFGEIEDADERDTSRLITRHYGITETAVPADHAWPLSEYSDHGPHPDDPYFAVYQPLFDRAVVAAKEDGVWRLLTGDRGDEMVGDWVFDYMSLLRKLRWRTMVHELQAHGSMENRSWKGVAKQHVARPFAEKAARRFPGSAGRRARQRFRRGFPGWVHPDLAKRTQLDEVVNRELESPPLRYPRDVRYGRIFSPAGVRMAVWADRTRAAYGVEHADPWSDRRVAETVMATPPRVVQRGGERKRLIRRSLGSYYPPEALDAAGKTEPRGLFERGFRDRAKETIHDLIDGSKAAELGFVDATALREAYQDYLDRKPIRYDFWWPLTFEIWLRRYW